MTRARDISNVITDANFGGTLDATGVVTANAGVSVDNITIDGTEIDLSSGDLTIDVASNINLDADGGTISLQDDGTEVGRLILNSNGGDLIVSSRVQDKDIVFTGNDGGNQTEFVRIDMSNDGETTIQNKNGGSGLVLHRDFSGSDVTSNTNTAQLEFSLSDSGVSNQTIAKISPQATTGTGNALGGIMRFFTSNTSGTATEHARIDANGQVFFGCTTTSSGVPNESGIVIQNNGNQKYRAASIGNAVNQFYNSNGTLVSQITVGSSSASLATVSDYRLKENVDYNFDATSRIKQLKPCRFNFKTDANNTIDGFLAHEVSSIVPEAVSGKKDAMTEEVLYVDGDTIPDGKKVGDIKEASRIDPQGVDPSKLVPLLTKTLQEALTRIETLEAEVKALKG